MILPQLELWTKVGWWFYFFLLLLTGPIFPAVPTGFPQNVTVVRTTSRAIELEWEPVPIDQRNGDITHYEIELNQIMFSEEPGSELRSTSEPRLSTNLTGLQAFVEYTVRVRAVNSAGFGPFSPNVTAMTLTDSK